VLGRQVSVLPTSLFLALTAQEWVIRYTRPT